MSADQFQAQLEADRKAYVAKIKGPSPDWDLVQSLARMLSDAVDAPDGFVPLCEGAMIRLVNLLREEHERERLDEVRRVRRTERAIVRSAIVQALDKL